MLGVEFEGVEIDYCESCGVWLDEGELELLLPFWEGEALADWEEVEEGKGKEKELACPACLDVMKKVRLAPDSPVIDACRWGHGLFFERGELREFLSRGFAEGKPGQGRVRQVMDFLKRLFQPPGVEADPVGEKNRKERK